MKVTRNLLVILLSLLLSVPVFAKGSHGGRSSAAPKSSHAPKKSHASGSHDGHYQGGQGSSHKGGHYKNGKTGNHYRDRKHGTTK